MQLIRSVMRAHNITMAIPERLRLATENDDRVKEMSDLCTAIERELESGGTADDLIAQWHRHSRRQVERFEFQTYWKAVDLETFVREALTPPPAFDEAASYSEALGVLEALLEVAVPESEEGYYLGWLEEQFPNSNLSDLIYWPDRWFDDASWVRNPNGTFKVEASLSSDQILGYAMAVSGRSLSGAPENVALPFPVPKMKTREV